MSNDLTMTKISGGNPTMSGLREFDMSNVTNTKLFIKGFILCAVITAVWLLFSLPIIFYHLPQEVK